MTNSIQAGGVRQRGSTRFSLSGVGRPGSHFPRPFPFGLRGARRRPVAGGRGEIRVTTAALLALEDGTVFRGISNGAKGNTTGEVVFNTAMTGYQEILTDPSYSRQIITLTYPHIGNTGATPEDLESPAISAAGLVIRDLPLLHSSWRAAESLQSFLKRGKAVAIAGIDTRQLPRLLRGKGALAAC